MNGNNEFGGEWTKEKLNILKHYLNSYTTVLKNKPFHLIYIDAFAGTEEIIIQSKDQDQEEFIEGSSKIAIDIENKSFDEYIFVELDPERCKRLENLKKGYSNKEIKIKNEDANCFLQNFQKDWTYTRGVLFLDPFATEVQWATIEKIASFKALDTWILFPTSAIARMLPRDKTPDDLSPSLAESLKRIYGNESWRKLYRPTEQINLFDPDEEKEVRRGHSREFIEIYKQKLKELFRDRFLQQSRELTNSKGGPLFEFIFCAGNPKGVPIAKKIAKHIIEKI